jgi:hypothetical protein
MRAPTIATMRPALGLLLGSLYALGSEAFAQESEATEGPNFEYQTGEVALPNKVATLHLGSSYRYLDPAETEKLLVAWGNEQ